MEKTKALIPLDSYSSSEMQTSDCKGKFYSPSPLTEWFFGKLSG